jgi:hypothetical protein
MKTNRQLLILIALVSNLNGLAQQVVFDPAVLSTLVINHEAQQNVLVDIKEKETAIATAQTTIATQMAVIRELKQKVYNSHEKCIGHCPGFQEYHLCHRHCKGHW